jgi:hypothetical protein
MSRISPSVIRYIRNTVLGLPGIITLELLGSLAIGVAVDRMDLSKTPPPEALASNDSVTLPLVVRQVSSAALVRSLVIAGRWRPGVGPLPLDLPVMVGHCVGFTLLGCPPAYWAAEPDDAGIADTTYKVADFIGTVEAKSANPSTQQPTMLIGPCSTSVNLNNTGHGSDRRR